VRGAAALADAVRRVWASAFLPRALAYLAHAGVRDLAMAVVLQVMVRAEAAGVLFTAPPPGLEGEHWRPGERLINATLGLTTAGMLFLLHMPDPLLWGSVAMLDNFIPYVGAIVTTIAMLSVLQGVALIGRPTPDGTIDSAFSDFLKLRVGFMPIWTVALVALAILGDMWLHRSRSGLEVKATGFREEAARRNGVAVDVVQVRAYVVASVMAAAAGLFLGAEVGVGHPTVGENFPLMSIAAAVLGGAALAGGRGSYVGAFFGAFFFTLMINVISILGLSSAVGVIASGAMTLMAVFFYSGLAEIDRMLRKVFAARRALPGTAPAE